MPEPLPGFEKCLWILNHAKYGSVFLFPAKSCRIWILGNIWQHWTDFTASCYPLNITQTQTHAPYTLATPTGILCLGLSSHFLRHTNDTSPMCSRIFTISTLKMCGEDIVQSYSNNQQHGVSLISRLPYKKEVYKRQSCWWVCLCSCLCHDARRPTRMCSCVCVCVWVCLTVYLLFLMLIQNGPLDICVLSNSNDGILLVSRSQPSETESIHQLIEINLHQKHKKDDNNGSILMCVMQCIIYKNHLCRANFNCFFSCCHHCCGCCCCCR